jgi:DNA modification methylase
LDELKIDTIVVGKAGRERFARRRRYRSGYCRIATGGGTWAPRNQILLGDAAKQLGRLADASVDCVVTSPPYFLLRSYAAGDREIGTENNVTAFVSKLATVFDEVARVLTRTGSLWLNLGDSYSRGERYGAPAKSLLLAPERVLMALAERGWIVRNKVVWAKPNPMPASVGDRLTCTWEPLYFLVRSRDYTFDLDAIREPHRSTRKPSEPTRLAKYGGTRPTWAGPLAGTNDGLQRAHAEGRAGHPLGKNPGDVVTLATANHRGEHHAVFPAGLIVKPITATCPERVCIACGAPWQRGRRRDLLGALRRSCRCDAGWRRGIVLDPFFGAGTVGLVAEQLNRDWLGVELNAAYAADAAQRIATARNKRSKANGGTNE